VCFNAEASFIGAAVVGACGVATLAMVKRPREIPFAALPFAFGLHQALEGWTWLQLNDRAGAALSGWGVHLWVLYAWALLPLWVPVAVWLIEPDEKRRRVMVPLMIIGGALMVFMLTQVFRPTVEVAVIESNLDYVLPYQHASLLAIPYVLATCLTPTLSTMPFVRIFGIGNFLAMSAAALIAAADYSSIWCTFAAFLSIIILLHFLSQRRARSAVDANASLAYNG
jgi:hypothetical protein